MQNKQSKYAEFVAWGKMGGEKVKQTKPKGYYSEIRKLRKTKPTGRKKADSGDKDKI